MAGLGFLEAVLPSTNTSVLQPNGTLGGDANASRPNLLVDNSLEQKLRKWWGDDWYSVFEKNMADDARDLGWEMGKVLQKRVRSAVGLAHKAHMSGARCSSLPVDVAVHAWRYDNKGLQFCLKGKKSGACTLSCDAIEDRVRLTCQGRQLKGHPTPGKCKWLPDGKVINTTGGLVRGLVRPILWKHFDGKLAWMNTKTYWGIPYADTPERFTYAKPLSKRWPGVQVTDYWDLEKNSSLRMHCAGSGPVDKPTGGENCLFLDVYVPSRRASLKPRPVVAFIFASGFALGDAWQDGRTDATRIVLRDDVIWVAISARNALLGHWAHPSLTEEAGDGSAGNMGERDQRLALQWIQDNIAKFGGDPAKVTLLGHSSGAFDVAFHMASPKSHGLFSGAITESASFDNGWYWQNKEQAYQFYGQLGEAIGCPQDNGSGEQVACLRALPVNAFWYFTQTQTDILLARIRNTSHLSLGWDIIKALVSATTGTGAGFQPQGLQHGDTAILTTPMWPVLPFGLVVDHAEAGLPLAPKQLYESGRVANVPLYVNHERDEGTLFALLLALAYPWQKKLALTHDAVDAMLDWALDLTQKQRDTFLELYPHGRRDNSPFYRLSKIITDSTFACSAERTARWRSKHNKGSTWWGEHTFLGDKSSKIHSSIVALLKKDVTYFLGAHHCLPSFQIFGEEYLHTPRVDKAGTSWDEVDQYHHELIHCHFALFFHCGDPAAPQGSECRKRLRSDKLMRYACSAEADQAVYPFPAWDPVHQQRKELSPVNHGVFTPSSLEQSRCQFWDEVPNFALKKNACRGCAGEVHAASNTSKLVYV